MCLMETMQSKRQKLSENSENNWYLDFFFWGGGVDKVQRMMGMTFE